MDANDVVIGKDWMWMNEEECGRHLSFLWQLLRACSTVGHIFLRQFNDVCFVFFEDLCLNLIPTISQLRAGLVFEHEAEKKRNAVFDSLSNMHFLSKEDKMIVTMRLCKNQQELSMFFSLSMEDKAIMGMDNMDVDGDGPSFLQGCSASYAPYHGETCATSSATDCTATSNAFTAGTTKLTTVASIL
ncbi:RING/U-box superfamily protein [Striga asiatica]|uniref:RING/U-box superfamily protein n=1 Tax=Striga asiatica TaxID=4170 RepID=A0A5A7PIW6_STRAF|nr:RING/U-box superfamily protein [Striga asiatica]